jgi:hypothetical protein
MSTSRSFPSAALAVAFVAACGGSSSTPGGSNAPADAPAEPATIDVCALAPADVVAPLLAGAHAPELTGGPRTGTCGWRGDGNNAAYVTASRVGADRASFARMCGQYTPPMPTVDAGFGITACGRAEADGVTLWVFGDDDNTVLGVISTQGTIAQAATLLRTLNGRLPSP